MGELVPPLVITAAPAAVMGFLTWPAVARRRPLRGLRRRVRRLRHGH
ncbi:hypothetical protein [Streptomyces sp. NPDC059802]